MVKASGRHTAGGTFAIPHSIVNSANARRDEQTLMVVWMLLRGASVGRGAGRLELHHHARGLP